MEAGEQVQLGSPLGGPGKRAAVHTMGQGKFLDRVKGEIWKQRV